MKYWINMFIKVTKKIEKNEYEGFANGFPEWTLEPPQVAVRRKK